MAGLFLIPYSGGLEAAGADFHRIDLHAISGSWRLYRRGLADACGRGVCSWVWMTFQIVGVDKRIA